MGIQDKQLNSVFRKIGETKAVTTTLQNAIDFFDNVFCTGGCNITAPAGTYTETGLDLNGFFGDLTINGDTRNIIGLTWIHGYAIAGLTIPNAGSGTCSLSNSGNTVTVVGSGTNPNFATAGIVAGDKVWISHNSGGANEFTISSVAANVLTLTVTAPTLGTEGFAIGIFPNRKLEKLSAITFSNKLASINFNGWRFAEELICRNTTVSFDRCVITSPAHSITGGVITAKEGARVSFLNKRNFMCTAGTGLLAEYGGAILADYFVAMSTGNAYYARNGGSISAQFSFSLFCFPSILAEYGGSVNAASAIIYSPSSSGVAVESSFGGNVNFASGNAKIFALAAAGLYGIYVHDGATVNAPSAVVDKFSNGMYVRYNSFMLGQNAAAKNCPGYGWRAENGGVIQAVGAVLNSTGNGTAFSPTPSNSVGNVEAFINFS